MDQKKHLRPDHCGHCAGRSHDERGDFIEGFCLGLSQKLEVFQCLALGIIAAGASGENGFNMSPQQLDTYTSQWLSELQSAE